MFIIPCKYRHDHNWIAETVSGIRQHHPEAEIVVVDSASDDKSYFKEVEKHGAIIEDIGNTAWGPGAYWHCFKKYDRPFYFCIHDSVRVKGNMDCYRLKPLTILAHFPRMINPSFNAWRDRVNAETKYTYRDDGLGCYGIMFFAQRRLMERMFEKGVANLMPSNKAETGYLEGAYGFFFEAEGYDLTKCSLYGDILHEESPAGRSGPYPHNTSWQYPIEKFYAYHQGRVA